MIRAIFFGSDTENEDDFIKITLKGEVAYC
jgi:hypothetical protein